MKLQRSQTMNMNTHKHTDHTTQTDHADHTDHIVHTDHTDHTDYSTGIKLIEPDNDLITALDMISMTELVKVCNLLQKYVRHHY